MSNGAETKDKALIDTARFDWHLFRNAPDGDNTIDIFPPGLMLGSHGNSLVAQFIRSQLAFLDNGVVQGWA
ncbi:hypothetical protein M408DRAFT_330194 [Serendipita vermifera MAFF 305830]|uniref:Uncharacterized protein n=1 Tax=Serendipita vermifera MAFF 305830 TaxID=933852 RepID=A0A0C2WL40_SERVB|nr:hypothetical protein M408DRAFT_330194 [Serendipita vermifera MAFF 305830]